MAGTTIGGQKAAEKNKKSDPNFYKMIGSKGGSKLGVIKGFAAMDKEKVRAAGKKGGTISRRTSKDLSGRGLNISKRWLDKLQQD